MKESIYLYVACTLVRLMLTSECPYPCRCSNGLMQCTGLHEFINHTDIPENVTSVVYDLCSFKEISSPLRYRTISELKIRSSAVESISDTAFDEMDALKTLDLQDNALGSLSLSCFSSLISLQNLSLSRNRLTTLPERFFSGFPSLERVFLDDNKHFMFTPEMFLNTSDSLIAISCQRCNISELTLVTEALSGLVHLKELSLGGNNNLGNVMPFAFSKLPQLEIIGLDNCSIISISGTSFARLEKLRRLNLSSNLIENFASDTFVDSKTTLRVISLNDNRLSSLDKELLQWSRVQQLHLDNNPWNCDCNFKWIRDYKFNGFSPNATCAEPELVRGTSLFSYTDDCEAESLAESSSSFFIILIIVILVVVVIICVAVVSCLVFRFCKRAAKRKNHAREKRFSRYSVVYRDTVEPAIHLKPKSAAELLS